MVVTPGMDGLGRLLMSHSALDALMWAVLRGRDSAIKMNRSELPEGPILQMGNGA